MIAYKKDGLFLPVKSWCENVELGAQEQIDNLCSLPFGFHHLAIMPDCHQGYGMPIGGVLAAKRVIIPNAVGVDIGCGMCACNTGVNLEDVDVVTLKKIMSEIRKEIPLGFNKHAIPRNIEDMPKDHESMKVIDEQFMNARLSLGTLGGGNHFIELQKDKKNQLWVMIHSGSRNLGKMVAEHYNDIAVKLNEMYCSTVPTSHQLAFLPQDSQEFYDYVLEMNYCVDFALANRRMMVNKILDAVNYWTAKSVARDIINIAHNYASIENHFGENVWVHRKGATRVTKDIVGIIPGSQGTKSYIVRGKDNKDSFFSCSHGAGRKLGRKDAQKTLDLEDQKRMLDEQGIIHGIRDKDDLDEAPGAYKDITEVTAAQSDLVEIIEELTPIAVIKAKSEKKR